MYQTKIIHRISIDQRYHKMKKIIKAVLGGLGVSVVLAALFPSLCLKDDAVWTYQSDVGRVDVALAGNVSDGQIEIHGKELQVDKPRLMGDSKGNQGVVVQFPVSYLQKSYQITLTPRGKARDISLAITFRGENFQVHDQRKPAWVRFENIRLNGKPIAQEANVWHGKPFFYRAKNVKIGQSLTLNFDIQKPVSFTDIRWEWIIGLFIACSLLISCSDILRRIFNDLNKKDMLQVIAEGYSNIDVVYRRVFWIIFGFLCFAFGFYAIHFMWGNLDWKYVGGFYSLPWSGRAFEGRYAGYLFRKLFTDGICLPVARDVISFLFLALNAILLCTYWKLERRVAYYVLCGLILTAQPFTLSMLYFVHMLPEVFLGVTFALTALVLSEKIASTQVTLIRKVFLTVLSIVLLNLSLATYPVLINTLAVAFVGRLLVQSFEWDGSWKQFKSYFIPFAISAGNIASGIVSYKIMISFVFPMMKSYNTEILPLDQFPERFVFLLKQSFLQLCEYNTPFISQYVLWVFLGFTVLVALYICLTGNIKQKIVRLLLLGGALFSTQTAMLVSKTYIAAPRIELFGLVFFETLITVLALSKIKRMHNPIILAAIGVVWVSVVNDLDCLRVWKLGFDAEKMLWNRVLARMENQKDFDRNRKYKIVQIGMPIALRPRFYGKPWPKRGFDRNNVGVPLTSGYEHFASLFSPHTFYYQTDFRRTIMRPDRPNDPRYKAQLKRLWEAGVLDKAQAWPHENGLIVWKDVILFVTDAKLLEEYKKQLAQEFPRQPQNTP